jgi:hypothetical protein
MVDRLVFPDKLDWMACPAILICVICSQDGSFRQFSVNGCDHAVNATVDIGKKDLIIDLRGNDSLTVFTVLSAGIELNSLHWFALSAAVFW